MDVFSILSGEHRVIGQVLACLEKIVAGVQAGGNFDAPSVREVLEFFRHYADHAHHAREEDVLFARIEAKAGFSRAQGPTASLRAEHVQARSHVQAIRMVLEADKPRPNDMARFIEHAKALASGKRQHMQKEEQQLFPALAEKLTPSELQELARAFEHVQQTDRGAGTSARYVAMANALSGRYGVPHVQAPHVAHQPQHVPMPPPREPRSRW